LRIFGPSWLGRATGGFGFPNLGALALVDLGLQGRVGSVLTPGEGRAGRSDRRAKVVEEAEWEKRLATSSLEAESAAILPGI